MDGAAGAPPVRSAASPVRCGARDGQPRIVVVGVGNPMRGDDGAGIAVVARAWPLLPPSVEVHIQSGEATALLDAWEGADLAVVVDAARWATPPEFGVTRIDAVDQPDALSGFGAGASSHSLGLAEAVGLGRVLDRLPKRLVLLLVAISDDAHGAGLSVMAEQRVGEAVLALVAEVHGVTAAPAG
ncbi:MAG: hydrogenase maturation protease [Candidatus Dormibacteria bacterium]